MLYVLGKCVAPPLLKRVCYALFRRMNDRSSRTNRSCRLMPSKARMTMMHSFSLSLVKKSDYTLQYEKRESRLLYIPIYYKEICLVLYFIYIVFIDNPSTSLTKKLQLALQYLSLDSSHSSFVQLYSSFYLHHSYHLMF